MSFKLKEYQKQTLAELEAFLTDARVMSVPEAFTASMERQNIPAEQQPAYCPYSFGEVPYLCLRLPTGGGKTVLASHAVRIAARTYLEQDYPVVLWLVPTNAIKSQTLEALKTVGHPYREELDRYFDHRVRVLDDDEVTQIRPQDIGNKTIVVVTTIANLRVEDTSIRKVYAYHEDFEPHFAKVNPNDERFERVSENDLKENGLSASELGKIKFSFANLLAMHKPLIIMDEAHNARTSLTFETFHRVHPACIIEFTATPDTSRESASNVLYHVSASELKAEDMIKLPIMLTEHNDWKAAVRDSVLTRQKLEAEAQHDTDYIRPIVLFQADKKNGEVTVDVLKAFLMEELHVEEEKIAIATGTQRELDGINLFERGCKIEHIITIEALKEGWDCSFAYVFCSVRDVRSSKDAEQLLGRVLRMPFAKRREVESLNRAYAHLASPAFSRAASELTDKLINMGFEEMEIPASLQHGKSLSLFGGDLPTTPQEEPPLVLQLSAPPAAIPAGGEVEAHESEDGSYRVEAKGYVSDETATALTASLKGKEKKEAEEQIRQHNARIEANRAPAQQGVAFAALPQLVLAEQGELALMEPEAFLYINGAWSLLDYKVELPNYNLHETETTFEVDIEGKRLSYRNVGEQQAEQLNLIDIGLTETDMVRWLDRELRQPDVPQPTMIKYLVQLVGHLSKERGISLTALERSKFVLVRAIAKQINLCREKAASAGFQQLLFTDSAPLEASFEFGYRFEPNLYPARAPFYQGRFKFRKHFYPVIEDLKADGEEYTCAMAIENQPMVKQWVRNLVRREHASFRLPLAMNWFYPDFVAELTDGRMFVIEYKGEAYKTNDDSREKDAVGQLWASKSDGKCLFLMAVEEDNQGRNVFQQINDAVKTR